MFPAINSVIGLRAVDLRHLVRTYGFVLTAITCVLCSGALAPSYAYAKPSVAMSSKILEFRRVAESATYYYRSSEGGTGIVEITNSAGELVWRKSTGTISADTRSSFVWTGRASKGNPAGYDANNYVKAGAYTVKLTVKSASGQTSRTKQVVVKASPKPKFSAVSASRRIVPSSLAGTSVFSAKAAISERNDVFVYIKSDTTKKRVARLLVRNASPGKALTFRWDGQVQFAGSVRLPDGEVASAGDVAPPGKYSVIFVSNGARVTRSLIIDPTPVSSIKVKASRVRLRYNARATLATEILPQGAYDRTLSYKSSDSTIVKVDSNGVVTAQRAEGRAKVVVTSNCNEEAVAEVSFTVSDSTLAMSDFLALPKWLTYKSSRKIAGTVVSNYPIQRVRIKVVDTTTGVAEINQVVSGNNVKSFDVKAQMNKLIKFGALSAGFKTITVSAADSICSRMLYSQDFAVIGPTRYKSFWTKRLAGIEGQAPWVFPLDVELREDGSKKVNISSFGSVRDEGARAHAAIDFIEPVGTKIYAMADGIVERISVGTYYAGTGAVQIKHADGAVIWYCEVKAAKNLKVGDKVKQNQIIATVQRNSYGTSMLHLEAYSGAASGALYSGSNTSTYDNVTPVRFLRRRDLVYPHGILDLPIPESRAVASE